jgi:hypothetical protein
MFTAVAMACLLGQYQTPFAGPGSFGTAGFPVASCAQCTSGSRTSHLFHHHQHTKIDYNFFTHDENWHPIFSGNVCPIGTFVPCGDVWAASMHEGMAYRAAMTAASTQPANPPAGNNPPAADNPPNPPANPPAPSNPADVPAVPLP